MIENGREVIRKAVRASMSGYDHYTESKEWNAQRLPRA